MSRVNLKKKKGPNLSYDLTKLGANVYSNLEYAHFSCKKVGPGWMDGWVVKPS